MKLLPCALLVDVGGEVMKLMASMTDWITRLRPTSTTINWRIFIIRGDMAGTAAAGGEVVDSPLTCRHVTGPPPSSDWFPLYEGVILLVLILEEISAVYEASLTSPVRGFSFMFPSSFLP